MVAVSVLIICSTPTLQINRFQASATGLTEISNPYLKFGVNYLSTLYHYEQKHLNDSTLDRDFKLFKEQGLEFIVVTAIWKYLEPQLGKYDPVGLADLRRVCESASEHGLQVVVDFHTMMDVNSFTMPEWLSPRKFETVFTNSTVRQAWLGFLSYTMSYLDGVGNINSWHMMNEPALHEWACNVSIDDFVTLWREMRAAVKSQSQRPVSIRFAAGVFNSHFNRDPRIYEVCDYVSLNWYENETMNPCTPSALTDIVADINAHGRSVFISEFGYETDDDSLQNQMYGRCICLFRNTTGISLCSPWYWRADYNNGAPISNYNLARNVTSNLRPVFMPRPAFYLLYPSGAKPSIHTAVSETPLSEYNACSFDVSDTLYICGEGYRPDSSYPAFIVEDRDWSDNDAIPSRIGGTAENVWTNWEGKLQIKSNDCWKLQAVWKHPLISGKYDIVIDIDNDGRYNPDVDVLYDGNVEDSAGFSVRVAPPTASFDYSPLNPHVGETVMFNASSSYDSDGAVASYEWSMGDGTKITGNNPLAVHTYLTQGTYTVELTVVDDSGMNDTETKIVVVKQRALIMTDIAFRDASGITSLYPAEMEALAPNGTRIVFSSFTNQLLDDGAWVIKRILWQGGNVKPLVDPTYTPTLGGTWVINCRAYDVFFAPSQFRDSGGFALYSAPSSFRLMFQNGTASPPLSLGRYLMQNGTTAWSSIIWQRTDVAPSASFNPENGDPAVNCRVYSLRVNPTFQDSLGLAAIFPDSWSLNFPNGTVRTSCTPLTCSQAQYGNYTIISILLKGSEVVPKINPQIIFLNNTVWASEVRCLAPTGFSLSLEYETLMVLSVGALIALTISLMILVKRKSNLRFSLAGRKQ